MTRVICIIAGCEDRLDDFHVGVVFPRYVYGTGNVVEVAAQTLELQKIGYKKSREARHGGEHL